MSYRAYIVDDEPLAIRRLERLLAATSVFELAGSTTDPERALEFLSSNRVDVLFLDIQMPGMNGFELLARLADPPPVIFTTAYDQYALKAFEVNSIDYLLKPVEPQQLDRVVAKLGSRGLRLNSPELRAVLEQLAATLRAPEPRYLDRIASRTGERVQFIPLDRITHFFAQDKLTFAAAAGGRNYCVDHSIAELEKKLDPQRFVRIHRSTLLNLDWVQEMDPWAVRLKDEKRTELAVARDRARALKARLGLV